MAHDDDGDNLELRRQVIQPSFVEMGHLCHTARLCNGVEGGELKCLLTSKIEFSRHFHSGESTFRHHQVLKWGRKVANGSFSDSEFLL